jgi:hypothetical protein
MLLHNQALVGRIQRMGSGFNKQELLLVDGGVITGQL